MKTATKTLIVMFIVGTLVISVLGGMYYFTFGVANRSESATIQQATERLMDEFPDVDIQKAELYNGTTQYVVFELDGSTPQVAFVPISELREIEIRDLTNAALKQNVCDRALQETGGELVGCRYGFDERALIEAVTRIGGSYVYSYYTYQDGEFLKRVQLTDANETGE